MANFSSSTVHQHVEHLVWSSTENKFYTLVTPLFGGESELNTAISMRSSTLSLLKMGIREVEPKRRELGLRNLYPCDLTHEELQDQFSLYGNYNLVFGNNFKKVLTPSITSV